ncbi:hypothetical protein KIM372_11840 [Bombiscardovia nodaiensis]|uniref:Cell division protein FtsL n=1 Tax=Bombiscardovia nodaiensis TaxID=2932181 RepID=A0ABM8B8R5_9BIFI|nr:hypothetical protein KIM372_11840 [Bombiscardovia nodaiensis]
MASTARSVRSMRAPDQRRPGQQSETRRPQLSLIEGGRSSSSTQADTWGQRARGVASWASTRSTPLIYFVVALVFLSACLVISLLLRTQMVQNSFEASSVRVSISQLTQDVQDDQNKLDQLQAALPDKAQQMGMVPQQGVNSIDLNGYQPSQQMQPSSSSASLPTSKAGQEGQAAKSAEQAAQAEQKAQAGQH